MLSGPVGRVGRAPSVVLRSMPTSNPAKNARHCSGTERGSFRYCSCSWSMYSALARLTKSNGSEDISLQTVILYENLVPVGGEDSRPATAGWKQSIRGWQGTGYLNDAVDINATPCVHA